MQRDPRLVSGAWVFCGTRIQLTALFENLDDGISLADFEQLFPGVTPQQPRSMLEHAARSMAAAVACVRILFDEGTSVPLRRSLNGLIVARADEVPITTDTNLR